MAGSYNAVVTKNGNLKSNESLIESLETGGDTFEAVEELYGMIWFLAWMAVAPHLDINQFKSLEYAREMVKDLVEHARQNYDSGLAVSKEVNKKR